MRSNEWGSNEWGSNEWGSNEWGSNVWGSNEWGSNEWGSNEWGSNEWGSNEWGSNEWGSNEWGSLTPFCSHFFSPYVTRPFPLYISPRQIPVTILVTQGVSCRVTRGGRIYSYRNHAHRLARDVWSDWYAANGTHLGEVGRLSAQKPQASLSRKSLPQVSLPP